MMFPLTVQEIGRCITLGQYSNTHRFKSCDISIYITLNFNIYDPISFIVLFNHNFRVFVSIS